jgi:hypothetical protein
MCFPFASRLTKVTTGGGVAGPRTKRFVFRWRDYSVFEGAALAMED